jgi:Flp pilus assembly protein TadG
LKRLRRAGGKRRPGQALVEFALTGTIFVLTVLTLFDGGRAVIGYAMLTYAVQEGGRAAALPAPATNGTSDVCSAVASKAILITVSNCTPTVTSAAGVSKAFADRTTGDRVQVSGDYTFSPIVSTFLGKPITFHYTSVYTVE